MSTKTMYILLNNGQINGNLCSHNGVLCYICPNYVELSKEPLKSKDANTHCHAVQVPEGDIKEVKNGKNTEHWLWKGPHEGKYNEGDKSTLPISDAGDKPEASSAVDAEDPLPLDVQFASLVVQMPAKDLDAWPNMGKTSVKEWKDTASALLNKFAESKNG